MNPFGRHSRRTLTLTMLVIAGACGAVAQSAPEPYDPLSFRAPDISERFQSVEIQQQLGAQVPMDLMVRDESGARKSIGEIMNGRPAILALVWFECPMLCTQVINGVEGVLDSMKYQLGEEYVALMVSIDPDETAELAAQKKANHLERLSVTGGEEGWRFLTADEPEIDRLADTVGYMYVYDPVTDQYAHDAGIIVLTPSGVVSKYYYGIDYLPRDVEFGLVEASQGKVGSLADKLRLICFLYDPATGTYGFYVIGAMRIGAVIMIVGFLTLWTVSYIRSRRPAGTDDGPSGGTSAEIPGAHHGPSKI